MIIPNRTILVAIIAMAMTSNLFAKAPEEVQRLSMATFKNDVQPLLRKYCIRCHGTEEQEGDVRLDTLNPDIVAGQGGENWHDALNQLNVGDMPPEDELQPSVGERAVMVAWITKELARAAALRSSTGGRVVVRRLTTYEYANTMRDLLGVNMDFVGDLPSDPLSPDGFRNNGAILGMSDMQLSQYLDIARRAIADTIMVGERPEPAVPTTEDRGGRKRRGIAHYNPKFVRYPGDAEFRIRVTASAPPGADGHWPTLDVHLGHRNNGKSWTTESIGHSVVRGPKPQVFEYFGRFEDFPVGGPDTFPSEADRKKRGSNVVVMCHNLWDRGNGRAPPVSKKHPQAAPLPAGPKITVHSIEIEVPYFDSWPPRRHTAILFPSELRQTDERAYAREVLNRFMTRAFRQPVTDVEVDKKLALYDKLRAARPSLEMTMREVLPNILSSPKFLYLLEPTGGRTKKQHLTQHELASRLSYLLWSTMPDESLMQLANQGRLSEGPALERQVRSMLADDRVWDFVQHFTDQWLEQEVIDSVAVNSDYYPNFDGRLKQLMTLEARHFFAEVLRSDLSALNFFDSDFIVVNRPLALHYGIKGPTSDRFERVALKPDSVRGGLMTQAGTLLANSTGDNSHPIRRGNWILSRLLGDPPPPPPPNVPVLDTTATDVSGKSLKEQLAIHRDNKACNSCHRAIDPWGLPLENFDGIGKWRTEVVGKVDRKTRNARKPGIPVEADTVMPGGQKINGVAELKAYILTHEKDRFARGFVQQLLTYCLGRSLEWSDQPTVDPLIIRFQQSDYQIDELIVAIVKSDAFQTK